ncbi:MAG: sugar phosphate isomerase/epimerase family protein [Candidatus Heimdallarchaeaceae archaeon]
MVKIGFSIDVRHIDPLAKANEAAKCGIEYLELKLDNPKLDPEHITSETKSKMKKIIADYSLKTTVHAPYIGVNLAGPGKWIIEASMKRIIQAIEAARQWEAEYVLIHGARVPHDLMWENQVNDWVETFVDNVRRLVNKAQENGLMMVVENTTPSRDYNIIDNLKKLEFFLEKVEGIGAVIDIGHLHLTSNVYSLEKFVRKDYFAKKIVGFHIHNNHKKKDEHLGYDKGTIDFQRLKDSVFTKFLDRLYVCEMANIADVLHFKEFLEFM